MPVWPKTFYAFGLSLKTAATEWKLRQTRRATIDQDRTFARLLPRLAAASVWREAGIQARLPYARFREGVPLQTYASLAPAIDRARQGEANVLWPGTCALFALTSGTTTGEGKYLPVTEEMLAHVRRACRDALLYYTVRAKHAGVFRGRHVLVGGSTQLNAMPAAGGHEAFAGGASAIVALTLPAWVEKHLYEPGTTAASLADWGARLEAMAARTCGRDVSLVAGVPAWLAEFGRELRQRCAEDGKQLTPLQKLWPNLECLVHTGSSVAPYAGELRELFGTSVKFHEVYAATEGFIAAQDTDAPAAGLRLMADLGVFFEFLPMSDFDESRIAQLGTKAVPLSDVTAGIDYAVVLTTPGGLVRYVLEDVVRFVSTEPPRLLHRGRTTLRLHALGENVCERELTDAIVAVCSRSNWTIANFHVAPLFANHLTGSHRGGRHEWWLELKPGTVATPTGPQIALGVDAELQRTNADYAARRKTSAVEAPIVRLVMPGVFEHWLRYQERWGGEHRLARCRNDRAIADELAHITNFARD